ncbi:porin [Tropicimonas sp. IMCC6043]|uniref:porin n=1 Tax=Tropicimonas sp. IMCC6043 TaxID=2510645 RepID=UPI00101B70D5|nr:porin [Tropicimonas sp. IMCC6043]RYH09088.1 porin [Tropicimonas sp. IMCC6043]
MKKVLLTSTALVAFAGAAAAEVTVSGWAEMGVAGGSDITTQFFQDVDVDFTMSGETDNGLTFGANVDLDEAGGLGSNFNNQGVDIFLSGEFGTVTLGDTDGALDWAIQGLDTWGDPGSIDDSETAHWGWQDVWLDGTYDGQILRYDYTYEDFGFAVSIEQDDRSDFALDQADEDRFDYNWAIGAKYSGQVGPGTLMGGIGYQQADFGAVSFGLTDLQVQDLAEQIADLDQDQIDELEQIFGYDRNSATADQITVALGENTSVWAISGGYQMDNGFSFGGIYSDWSGDNLDKGSYWGVGAGYAFDAFSIHANYGEHNFEYDGGGELDTTGWGAAAGYDLGGGLSILAGYGWSQVDLSGPAGGKLKSDFDTFSFGLSMSF